jgi:hypothetical protein
MGKVSEVTKVRTSESSEWLKEHLAPPARIIILLRTLSQRFSQDYTAETTHVFTNGMMPLYIRNPADVMFVPGTKT